MNEINKPAPVWRLLEPGEIIREEDEVYWHPAGKWIPVKLTRCGEPMVRPEPVRRRMEPDPVKAELLAALIPMTKGTEWITTEQVESARAAIARA